MDSRGAKCTDRRSKQLSLSQSVTHSKHSARCFSHASWCLTTPRLTWKITTETGLCVVTVTNSVVNKLVTDHATSRVCALKRLVIRHCSRPSAAAAAAVSTLCSKLPATTQTPSLYTSSYLSSVQLQHYKGTVMRKMSLIMTGWVTEMAPTH